MTTPDLTVSIVVNTTDRSGPLRTLLRALEHQAYSQFEVIAVVGPTRDDTLETLSEYSDRVRVLRCPTANLGRSRNIGLLAARGDIVAFVDDDAVPSQRWLEQIVRLFSDPSLDATGGVVHLIHPDIPIVQHRLGIVSALAEQVDVRTSWLDALVPSGESRWWIGRMMGTNMAFRRRPLVEVGGFDEYFEWVYDDTDVSLRLAAAGRIVHPVKEARIYHVPASSRNRVALSYNVRWWFQTKAAIYFSIKNGAAAGESAGRILRRCLHLWHGHWLWSRNLLRENKLTIAQFWRMRLHEVQSAISGAAHGLLFARQMLKPAAIESSLKSSEPIMPFQNEYSAHQPTVDPVSGYRPAITLPDQPLRLCLLSSAYPPAQLEGVGRHTHLMARGLFECGHTVHVVTRGDRDQISFYDGAYVHQLAQRHNRYDQYQTLHYLHSILNHSHAVYECVRQLILNDGIQIVDSPVWQIDGLVTAISGVAPVIVRVQTALRQIASIQRDRDDDARLIGELEQSLIEHAAYLVPNSQATLRAVQQIYGTVPTADRYSIIPHGIAPVPDDAVRPFDIQHVPDKFTVLYVGRLERRKGIQDLFQAIPQILKRFPNVEFIIAGNDNSQYDGFRQKTGVDYPTYFADHFRDAAPRVQFLGGVSDSRLQQLYQACDVFVAPSVYESFGLIYLEAMNYAKPVIGCRAGGIPEVIDDGVTGKLVDPESPIALAEAVVSLLQAPAKLREMGLAGRQRLLEKFTYLQMARGFERVYRSVVQNREVNPSGGG
jgi:glycogen synthase